MKKLWILLISFVLLAGSCSNKKLLAVDKLESFKVTSKNLKRGVWDSKISNTNKGENCSPELSWKKVEGATQYIGPYPPKGSTHTYAVYVFALKNEPGKVKFLFNNGGNAINLIYYDLDVDSSGNNGNVIACSQLKGKFTN